MQSVLGQPGTLPLMYEEQLISAPRYILEQELRRLVKWEAKNGLQKWIADRRNLIDLIFEERSNAVV